MTRSSAIAKLVERDATIHRILDQAARARRTPKS